MYETVTVLVFITCLGCHNMDYHCLFIMVSSGAKVEVSTDLVNTVEG